jgi:transcriptional regulator with XRE-family HTH domain
MSEVIRERRTAIGMSQRGLAKAAGVDVRQKLASTQG